MEPSNHYQFKVVIETLEKGVQYLFKINNEDIFDVVLVSLLLALNIFTSLPVISIVDLKQVPVC